MNNIALYPGTFDPVTLGHQDLINRAARIFGTLFVGVARLTSGKQPMFTVEERVELLRGETKHLRNVQVLDFHGLLVHHARHCGATVLVRGIRAFSDFETEFQMALMNRKMAPDLETLFLMPKEEYSYVSSSLVREVARLGGDTRQNIRRFA